MTAYGMVITVLLIFPWVLFGVVLVGAALERLERGLRSTRPTRQRAQRREERPMGSTVSRSLSEYGR